LALAMYPHLDVLMRIMICRVPYHDLVGACSRAQRDQALQGQLRRTEIADGPHKEAHTTRPNQMSRENEGIAVDLPIGAPLSFGQRRPLSGRGGPRIAWDSPPRCSLFPFHFRI
jgi:hypothetical protein